MTIAKISNTGLLVTGILVAVLWGIILTDRLILRTAHMEVIRTMKEIENLQQQKAHSRPHVREKDRVQPVELRSLHRDAVMLQRFQECD
jgi:hypothetical protein